MKLSNIMFLALIVISWLSCSNCEELVLEPCGSENSMDCGLTVATCFAEVGEVGVIYDTRRMSDAPRGADWTTSSPTIGSTHPANWTSSALGQVFGITIDSDENIYLASSDIYAYDGIGSTWISSNGVRPYSPTQVFKCSPPSYTAIPFFRLPVLPGNESIMLNGTGNIAYDQWNNQFFVTNLDDGRIYRFDIDGFPLESYDPWGATVATAGAIVSQDQRVWGVNVNNENGAVKVYFPRVTNNGNREIYSLTLNAGAFPPSNSEVVEISGVRGTSEIISDIAFSADNTKMLIAERGDPHLALVMSYNLLGGTWIPNVSYFVGDIAVGDGENAAGGVDFFYSNATDTQDAQCDEAFWATGNFMSIGNNGNNRYYGLQGIDYVGNNSSSAPFPTANKDTDFFIDFDGVPGVNVKRTIGDVEVFNCARCDNPCELDGY